jgi:S-DNA-T family DNA segregation ATPase FtsK/SpoIIIE
VGFLFVPPGQQYPGIPALPQRWWANLPLTSGRCYSAIPWDSLIQSIFGFDGGTVFLLLAWGAGLSLFTGLSWIGLGGKDRRKWTGKALFGLGIEQMADPPGPNGRGMEAVSEREEVIREERKRTRKEPVRIEPAPAVIEKIRAGG